MALYGGDHPEVVVVNGQVESRWPIYNTVLKDGKLYFSAGRHVELDGGIQAWALNAESGAVEQKFTYFQPMSVMPASTINQTKRSVSVC